METGLYLGAVRLKAGYVGQVFFGNRVLWESEVFPEGQGTEEVMQDKLKRHATEVDAAEEKAKRAARDKVYEIMENLFNGQGAIDG